MWTLRVAVAVGGIGVDANLRILQVPKSGWLIVERVASLNYARKRRGVVQFSLRPVCGRRTQIKYAIGLTGLAEAFRQSWYQSMKSLVWLIEEIRVVEEMIRRRVPSV
ncbi:hypothetical protein Taro_019001 [Colocasia esculenta]|uniref:Uncharacterized protein n=1 Tax=Colocasia esculenta TaxID=4460 RepID=A0A843V463_COLES|nr:hypothetical protein [Colocasia esculenta]